MHLYNGDYQLGGFKSNPIIVPLPTTLFISSQINCLLLPLTAKYSFLSEVYSGQVRQSSYYRLNFVSDIINRVLCESFHLSIPRERRHSVV